MTTNMEKFDNNNCRVCNWSTDKCYNHYGGEIVCPSCRNFFRRAGNFNMQVFLVIDFCLQ